MEVGRFETIFDQRRSEQLSAPLDNVGLAPTRSVAPDPWTFSLLRVLLPRFRVGWTRDEGSNRAPAAGSHATYSSR